MRRRSAQVALAGVLFVLGILAVAQFNAQSADQGLSGLSVSELTELVANVTTRNNQLRDEIAALESQRQMIAGAVQRGDTSSAQIRSDLNRVLGWSGALPVTGAGVRLTISGELPGDAIELLMNELRNAGCEAVAIGGVRVVPGVVTTGPAGAVVVRGVLVKDPITITAVGQPQVLAGSLGRAGGPIAQLGARFPDVVIGVATVDLVTVPATDRDLTPQLGKPSL
ncbi:MAG TPA: DUF881 domain-containing protein [Candidatus Limnocylindrales bacterium]|jgi:uncharacterized protein YlxW (UPF0749 family)|nr:DUF881 domain-containing protein [Candidatus Limnocylindrales bacterium]